MTDPDRDIGPLGSDASDEAGDRTSGILEVPITWLDLTPPSGPLHLKLMEARDAHLAHIWSREVSPDQQMAWARSQAGWTIRDEYRSSPHVVSFTVESLPAGLAWLAQLSSYQHLELQADGSVQLHLIGLREDIQDIHQRLRRATDVELIRVADAEEDDVPVRGPRLTAAQRTAIQAAYSAGFFEVPRETGLDELAEDLGRSRSSLSTLLRRGIAELVEHLLGEEEEEEAILRDLEDDPKKPVPDEETSP